MNRFISNDLIQIVKCSTRIADCVSPNRISLNLILSSHLSIFFCNDLLYIEKFLSRLCLNLNEISFESEGVCFFFNLRLFYYYVNLDYLSNN